MCLCWFRGGWTHGPGVVSLPAVAVLLCICSLAHVVVSFFFFHYWPFQCQKLEVESGPWPQYSLITLHIPVPGNVSNVGFVTCSHGIQSTIGDSMWHRWHRTSKAWFDIWLEDHTVAPAETPTPREMARRSEPLWDLQIEKKRKIYDIRCDSKIFDDSRIRCPNLQISFDIERKTGNSEPWILWPIAAQIGYGANQHTWAQVTSALRVSVF